MFSAESKLPISNYSTVVISDAAGTTFDPLSNSRVRINIPSRLGMVDMANSYMQFDMRVKPPAGSGSAAAAGSNTYMMKLSNDQGAEQVMRNLRVSLDQREVENLAHYNIISQFKDTYGEDVSARGVNSTFDHSAFPTAGNPSYFVESYDAETGFMVTNNIATKQLVRPKCSGLLNHPVGLPLMLLGNMAVEMDLETSASVLTPIGSGIASAVACEDVTSTAAGEIGGAGVEIQPTLVQAADPKYAGYQLGKRHCFWDGQRQQGGS